MALREKPTHERYDKIHIDQVWSENISGWYMRKGKDCVFLDHRPTEDDLDILIDMIKSGCVLFNCDKRI